MILRPLRIHAYILIKRDFHLRQANRADTAHLMQRWQYEEMVSHHRRGRVTWEGEDDLCLALAVVVLEGNGGEGGGFSGFHGDAAEVDRAA